MSQPVITGSRQDAFAKNLSRSFHGIAVYKPIEKGLHSGRIGDIGFFNDQGKYRWVHNAFFSEVSLYEYYIYKQTLIKFYRS